MAKKKRKHFIKLNNKIKALFKGSPFEDGITEVDDNTLFGLIMLLGDDIGSLERADIIKYLRRVWSEGNHSVRKAIVDFIEESQKERINQHKDKIEYILSILDELGATPQESEIILEDVIDKKLSKITKDKLSRKLFYLKMSAKLDEFSKILDVDFVGNDTIEFMHKHTIEIDSQEMDINLIHSYKLPYSVKELVSKEKSEVIEIINDIKLKAIENKKEEIEHFLEDIKQIEYLDDKIKEKIFKAIKEPVRDLYHCPIPLKVIKKIFRNYCPNIAVSNNVLNYLFSKNFEYKIIDRVLNYDIYVSYEKSVLYGSIWTNKVIDIVEDIRAKKKKLIEEFELKVNLLLNRLKENIYPLELDDSKILEYIYNFLEAHINSNKTLALSDKLFKRAVYRFNEHYKKDIERKKQEILLAKTIRDFKKLYPTARSLNREIIFNVGPTNSGKTYSALKELKKADTGLYLAPLRLLALEGYEDLKQSGVNVSLITGEEEIIDEESTHISSTIEMLNSDIEVDVCVIDEIQMINDRDRGWAWANALIGAPAKKIIITGSSDALNVVKEIAEYLDEPLKIVQFERKNKLSILNKETPINRLEESTAIVTFSRKEVLALKSKISPFFKVSVVYGNLSPEVRREEARRFREGESQVLIATDAISMGLNLPIKTILFARDNKFDGLQRRTLNSSEILQIAGRAGRYGLHENGYVGALDYPTLLTIKEKFNQPLKDIELPISVMATLEHVLLIAEILQTNNLLEILEFFAKNMEFDGPFVAANIDSMIEVAKIVDEFELDLVSKYHLACAPVSVNSTYLEKVFNRYLELLEDGKEVNFLEPKNIPKKAVSYSALLNAEDRVKEVSLYLWLSFKFPDKFRDVDIAREVRDKLNSYIERTLRETNFKKECKRCGKELDLSYRFSICDSCYNRAKRGYKKHRSSKLKDKKK